MAVVFLSIKTGVIKELAEIISEPIKKKSGNREKSVTFISVAYFFCIICSYYVVKPIRGSLVLELGAGSIPILNIFSMISLIIANAIYSWIVGRYKRDFFIPFITRFFVICLIIFWVLFSFVFPVNNSSKNKKFSKPKTKLNKVVVDKKPKAGQLYIVKVVCISFYYLWVNFFSLVAVSMFWSFMNDIFSVNQGRKLYAIIGYGGLLGGLAGSAITSLCVTHIGTSNLFILAIIILYPSIWCMQYIHINHAHTKILDKENASTIKPKETPRPWDGFTTVCKNPILICMALEMFLYTFSSTMFFQQMNQLVENEFADINARTSFIAWIYARINILSLFTQLVLTKLFMLLPNPIYGLLSMVLIQIAGTLITFIAPSLEVISWTIIIRYAINYSTGRALRELVFIPLKREEKYQGKGFIDTVVFRIGDGMSSMALIGGLASFGFGPWIDSSILTAMILQFCVIIKTAKMYSQQLKPAEMQTVSV